MMFEVLSCIVLGLGIWGMRTFGAGICIGHDVDKDYLDDNYHSAPCFVSDPVRVTISGVIAWVEEYNGGSFDPNGVCNSACSFTEGPDPATHGCVLQYYGVHILNRSTSNDLCRDGDESDPIEYEKTLTPVCSTEQQVTKIVLKSIAKSTSSGKPRIVVHFDKSSVPYGIQKYKDLDRRIPCGSEEGEDIQITSTGPAQNSACCAFEPDDGGYPGLPLGANIIVTADFSGDTVP